LYLATWEQGYLAPMLLQTGNEAISHPCCCNLGNRSVLSTTVKI